jgi:cellulose synthase (UDP-forming)
MIRWFARRMRNLRPHEREIIARQTGVGFAVFGGYYLLWRAGWSLNTSALWLAVPLLVAEALAYADFLMFLFMAWRVPPPRKLAAPPGLKVDIYITTYNESPELLRSTVLGALNMRYPHETYVLDDGCRAAVAKLAKQLGARYIAREDRSHAKAGNINHALRKTSGEYIAVFDADHVPHPQFLERLLGYFEDPRLALVQTPQAFYNLDSIQHSGERGGELEQRWHEQALFYHVIQPGKGRLNSVFWCGSNAVLRRAALESIGGCATTTVTEDIHTTIKLHAAGWRTAYHDETLSSGIAPDDLDAFLTQRRRWAQGTMQILRSRDNPLWARGLTLRQRISYWASMSTYFSSFQKLVLMITPIVVLATGILPMDTFGWNFLLHFAPYFVLGQLANSLLGRGHARYFDTERFNLLKAFAFVRASLGLFVPRKLGFQVTRKTQLTERTKELLGAVPHILLLYVTLGSLAWAAGRIYIGSLSPRQEFALELTAIWAVYNAGIIGLAVRSVVSRSHRRKQYRFEARAPIAVTQIGVPGTAPFEATTLDITLDGLSFHHERPLPAGQQVRVAIRVPAGRELTATAIVMSSRAIEIAGMPAHRVGVRFVEITDADRDVLSLYLFSEVAMPHVEALARAA